MSTRQTGNRYENGFCRLIETRGYCTFPSRGSRKVDILCVHRETLRCIGVEVGGTSKRLVQAFPKLREATVPIGTWFMVVRRVIKKGREQWRFYLDEDTCYLNLDEALTALTHT